MATFTTAICRMGRFDENHHPIRENIFAFSNFEDPILAQSWAKKLEEALSRALQEEEEEKFWLVKPIQYQHTEQEGGSQPPEINSREEVIYITPSKKFDSIIQEMFNHLRYKNFLQ
jgi:hypothetical protein